MGFIEIPDNEPDKSVDAVVLIAYPGMLQGGLGRMIVEVCNHGVAIAKLYNSTVIASNRWPVKLKGHYMSVAEAEKHFCVRNLNLPENQMIIPNYPADGKIRNTRTEAEFAIETLEKLGRTSILVVGNHIHMRRVVATFKKVVGGKNITLYWKSVGQQIYGPGYSQSRFRHPLFFLFYEVLATMWSKLTRVI